MSDYLDGYWSNSTKLWWQIRIEEQQAEIGRLRALNAKLVRKIDSACMALGLGLGDLLPGQKPVGAREWREIAERAYQALKADSKPTGH